MFKKSAQLSAGFTLVELMVVLAMVTVIVSLSSVNLTGLISDTSFDESLELIISDIRRQQFRAITGEEQQNSSRFGIHFEQTKYVLFSGDTYNPANPNNHHVSLPRNIVFESVTLPNSTIIFTEQSGEVTSYSAATDSLTIRHTSSNETKQLEFNSLGVVQIL